MERELNAFLARHLGDVRGMALTRLSVRLIGDGAAELNGQTTLRQALGDGAGGLLLDYVPAGWLQRPLWVRMRGRVRLETEASRSRPRSLRLDVDHLFIGRQRVPTTIVKVLLPGEAAGFLRWSVPEAIESVTIERGVAVIRVFAAPPRSGAEGRR